MPRDVNGNYTLPAGNPVVTDTNIESTWANNTMGDLAAEMTDSLSRSGKGGVTAPFQIVDENAGIPGLAFANEPTSGVKRTATGDVRMQVLGSDRMRWRSGATQRPEVQISAVWSPVAIEPADRKVMYGAGGATVAWFYNNTVPPGWTINAPDTNLRNLAIAPGGATPVGGGTIEGVDDPSNLAYTKDVTPAGTNADTNIDHTHAVNGATGGNVACGPNGPTGSGVAACNHSHNVNITSAGMSGNQIHTHAFTGTANSVDVLFNPRRAMGVLGTLDA